MTGPRWVIAEIVARSALKWALVWGAVFGLFVIATVEAFVVAYPTVPERLKIAESLRSFSLLLGQPHHAETVAGFTQWRVLVIIAIIGAVWGLLTSTGLFRGEEDAGRWELVLSGDTTKGRAAIQALLGLGVALVAMFSVTALVTLAASGIPGARFGGVGPSLLFAVALTSGAAMWLAIGSVASQLSATRSQAATITAATLGLSFVLRMVADATSGLGWLRWLSPIGWLEELRPLRDPHPFALLPVAVVVATCCVLTVRLASRRDLGASVLRERVVRPGGERWLVGPTSLAFRLIRPTALGWIAGIAGMALIQGFVARTASSILSSSPAFAAALGKLGAHQGVNAYLGVAFLIVTLLVAMVAASQMAAVRDEEAAGRLDNLLVRPVSRLQWLFGRVGTSLAVVLLAALAGGFATWLGAASQHAGVDLWTTVQAGINSAVPALVVLGLGVLVLGARSRLVSAVVYGIVAWSFLADLLGSLIKGSDLVKNSSLFTHIALAPAAKPDWGNDLVLVVIGVVAAVIGAIAFQRRDLEYA